MPDSSNPELRDQAVRAWMMAIADHGWHGASLALAAQAAGLSRADIAGAVGDRHDALGQLMARAADAAFAGATVDGGVRERLFDGLMAGLDVVQAERRAVLAVVDARDPGVGLMLAARTPAALRRIADAAGIDARGPRGAARMAGLLAVAVALARAWRDDDSPDMAATMAALDRLLERAEKAEVDGLSPSLLGLPAFPYPFRRVPEPAPDPPPK